MICVSCFLQHFQPTSPEESAPSWIYKSLILVTSCSEGREQPHSPAQLTCCSSSVLNLPIVYVLLSIFVNLFILIDFILFLFPLSVPLWPSAVPWVGAGHSRAAVQGTESSVTISELQPKQSSHLPTAVHVLLPWHLPLLGGSCLACGWFQNFFLCSLWY